MKFSIWTMITLPEGGDCYTSTPAKNNYYAVVKMNNFSFEIYTQFIRTESSFSRFSHKMRHFPTKQNFVMGIQKLNL